MMEAALAPEGLVIRASSHEPAATMERVVAAVMERGMSVIARIDHAAAAAKAGLALRATEVLVFGNPKAGTPLMQTAQTAGIDLPLKILVWQDEAGKTWLAYNDPVWLARRHSANGGHEQILGAMTRALAAIADEATLRAPSNLKAPPP
ncbi:MAG: DUF302 domain-containing protein [Stellaceae bacterium]